MWGVALITFHSKEIKSPEILRPEKIHPLKLLVVRLRFVHVDGFGDN